MKRTDWRKNYKDIGELSSENIFKTLITYFIRIFAMK